MSNPVQDKAIDAVTTVPFLSLFGYNFVSLNSFLETATLMLGLISGIFALFYNVRRWWRGRLLEKVARRKNADV